MKITEKGMLLVISGPSGCGKSTIVSNILARDDSYALSVSLTTREKREKEIDGVHYKFVTREDFEKALENDELLEHAEYNGNLYGTPAGPVKEMLDNGINVILEIEIQGAKQIVQKIPDTVSILIVPSSYKELEERLRSRKTDSEEAVRARLEIAKREIECYPDYEYIIINEAGRSDDAALDIINIVESERHRTLRNSHIPTEFFEL